MCSSDLNLVPRKTHFIGFILPDIPKPIHTRCPGLSKKLREPLTAASRSETALNDPRAERACPAKLVSKKADDIGLTLAGTMIGCAFDGPATCVIVEGGDAYWRESSTVVRSGLGHVIMALA